VILLGEQQSRARQIIAYTRLCRTLMAEEAQKDLSKRSF
jgi:hypothetical protein